jgi:hypothetical protein
LIFERVIEPERFFAFAALFCFVPPRFVALAPDLFDDFFDLRFAFFAMVPPGAASTPLFALTGTSMTQRQPHAECFLPQCPGSAPHRAYDCFDRGAISWNAF